MKESKSIVTLTPAAITHVKKMLAKDSANIGLRVGIKKRGCSGFAYVLEIVQEQPKTPHQLIQATDFNIFVDEHAVSAIDGTVLDYVNKGFGQEEWSFTNPKAESLCGCGESFNLREDK